MFKKNLEGLSTTLWVLGSRPAGKSMTTEERRAGLRQALLEAAERTIAGEGLKSLKARRLAAEANCAIGQIYNVWPDLDSLIIAVNARTLDDLDASADRGGTGDGRGDTGARSARRAARPGGCLSGVREPNAQRWRAVFEHRLAGERELPTWYREQQARLFSHVDRPLRKLLPGVAPPERADLGRAIFSAVHGVVWLGLEELLGPQSYDDLRRQLRTVMGAIVDGLGWGDGATR
jgi:AcrR family transcriptional regulator